MFKNSEKRSLFCGQFTNDDLLGKKYTVNGWVQNYRDHGELTFIDLRDRTGLLQLVFDPKENEKAQKLSKKLRHEDVVSATGTLRLRGEGLNNDKLATGKYELVCEKLIVLNEANTPPFEITDEEVKEDTRLIYRYLDLRRKDMQDNLIKRSKIMHSVRSYLESKDFVEIETPILNKSTPEGARDFLVPSRMQKGKFYALPQSPQIFKQLLMVGGLERYYQIARCFRDEDLRAERQPEFTQLDIELSFITSDDIMEMTDHMIQKVLKDVYQKDISIPIGRMTYQDAMTYYGNDHPDTRFEMKIVDVTDVVKDCDFSVFTNVVKKGGVVRCLPVENGDKLSRKDLDQLIAFVGKYGSKGMAWMRVKNGKLESNITKYFSEEHLKALIKKTDAKDNYALLFIADTNMKIVLDSISNLRLEVGDRLGLRDKSMLCFTWVTDFPLFEYSVEEKRWTSVHHPFTSPKINNLSELEVEDKSSILSDSYDIVLNGVELGGGSIRIYDQDLQKKMFTILGITPEAANEKFGFLLHALEYGAPPHGGIALGLDRMVMEFQGLSNIRDVIAFPKTQSGTCLMSESPSEVSKDQLDDLDLAINEKK